MKSKSFLLSLLAIALVFGMTVIGCDDETDNNPPKTNWWIWMAATEEMGFNATARISITPSSDDTACNVIVTGTPNIQGNGMTQVGYDYNATVGKNYRISWKWIAYDKEFKNVSIRYAQRKNYSLTNDDYMFGTNTSKLTIPTTVETKTYDFIMPEDCYSNPTFCVGEDTGTFKIYDFKIEEIES